MCRTRSGAALVAPLAVMLAPLLLTTGCGGEDASPASPVPALTQRLDAVDEAVAAHDDAATRTAVDRLEHTVHDAQQGGDLDQARAEEILSAAETLLKALPATDTPPSDTPPSDTTSTSPPSDPTQTPPAHTPPAPPEHEKKDKPPKPEKHDEHGHGPDHEH